MDQGTVSGMMRPAIPYSKTRVAGMALYWSWIFIMFNSIQPYAFLEEKRNALYLGLLISIFAAVAMLGFLALESKNGSSWRQNRPVVFISVAAMTIGTIVTPFCDTNSATGMLILGIGAIMTGSGSGPLLVCWCEAQAPLGGRATLCEVTAALLGAFLLSLVLAVVPPVVAIAVAVIAPGASLALLLKSPTNQFRPKSGPAAENGPEQGTPNADQAFPPVVLSSETKRLFVKGLAGAMLIGGLAGFFDVFTGFSTFAVEDDYGLFLFVAGSLSFLFLTALVWKFPRDNVFIAFRVAMLLMCLGFLAAPFLHTSLGVSSIVFAGYNCYWAVLLAVTADVSRSFRINRSRCVAIAFAIMYLGEALGECCSHALQTFTVGVPNLAIITLVAVSLLFISNLFLFTEVDLIKIGIGEVDLTVTNPRSLRKGEAGLPNANADTSAATDSASAADPFPTPVAAPEPQPDPAAIIIERFHLSPRESEVLPLLLEGRTISRIQETLFISQGTVSTHIRHIYQKTGSANRQELIDLAQAIFDEKSGGEATE